ncbi:MAG: DUF1284 domain-containing protein [Euryarchaeota archaeon]|nr:DUF1284 domain-containing protein [Euryarchaeota archaeon]
MREVRLRHHHLLCTRTFGGRGYDHRFVANMEEVVSKLRSPDGLVVRLCASCDDICSQCPNAVRGSCKDHGSVMEKDRAAALFLGLPEEALLPAGPLLELARERMLGLDDIRQVCGDCEWAGLCNEWLRSNRP